MERAFVRHSLPASAGMTGIPAFAGITSPRTRSGAESSPFKSFWTPAFAGVTASNIENFLKSTTLGGRQEILRVKFFSERYVMNDITLVCIMSSMIQGFLSVFLTSLINAAASWVE
jgi:hypothetical protein